MSGADHGRRLMVEQLRARKIRDERVLDAMAAVRREDFFEGADPYADAARAIGEGQTISQPYVVALMLEALSLRPSDRLLEVGAGSGYAAAVASELVARVDAIERIGTLADRARKRLEGRRHVHVHHTDGSEGWPQAAPYDAILVSAAGARVPPALLEQLADGGRLVMPVGPAAVQQLTLVTRDGDKLREQGLGGVRFVPLISG
ncbi:protein-L-isoaspartate(D-aspartate) O-methyltransferase [Sphingomicrobium aestuariivivum]|uniref:protein-L-isoaspartate(D-aspartate) O-methyltransferase n=1 Tax=Sphingomicrobium aestuariivivum TaxID=1582356 RepID=UPI001FD66806|nr:protein-L-isoaspartate(D-aspartate) O-methyltransferase [Sphingomicrobium aestuariivivum]MCJ8191737.1 protein-L-isoaspartate(D-aspartate) O-methyltransferase [Sphingomicrobium aestuariivivum]